VGSLCCTVLKDNCLAELKVLIADIVRFFPMVSKLHPVFENFEFRSIDEFGLKGLLFALSLANITEMMILNVMFIQLILVIEFHSRTEKAYRVRNFVMMLKVSVEVKFLLEH
jgi:hypothetical protein